MARSLKKQDRQGVDTIVFSMRSNEFDERDAPGEIESNDHSKIAAGDFEPGAFAIQNFSVRSGQPHIFH
jgi:hypothetical protein